MKENWWCGCEKYWSFWFISQFHLSNLLVSSKYVFLQFIYPLSLTLCYKVFFCYIAHNDTNIRQNTLTYIHVVICIHGHMLLCIHSYTYQLAQKLYHNIFIVISTLCPTRLYYYIWLQNVYEVNINVNAIIFS